MKKIYLLFTAVLIALGSYAAELTVADGTETNASLPICGYYADYLFQGQMLYPSIEVAAMSKGEISSLTFYSSTTAQTYGSGTISVKLAEVSESALSTSPLAPVFTEVYNGAYSIEDGKLVITFTTNFTYSGSKNLLLDISCVNKGTAPTSDNWFYGQTFSAAGYSNYVKQGTYTYNPAVENFLPKTTFAYTAETGTCAQPLSVGTSAVAAKSATLQWNKADAGDQVQYALVEEGKDAVWSDPTSDASKEFSGLKPLTNYSFYVRTYCSASDQSTPIKAAFTTDKACYAPKNISFSNIGANTATMNWEHSDEGEETAYQYVLVNKDATPDWENAKTVNGLNCELSGMKPEVDYDVYLRSNCGSDGASQSIMGSFKTVCGKITELPFSENFNDLSDLPACWKRLASSGPSPAVSSSRLTFDFADGSGQIAVLPEFESHVSYLTLNLKYSTWGESAQLEVGYMTNADDASTFHALGSYNETGETYKAIDPVDFKSAPTEATHIALRAIGTTAFLYVDDIAVKETPCAIPAGLKVDASTSNSITISWEKGDATAWTIQCGAKTYEASDSPYTISELKPNKAYEISIAAKSPCESEESDPVSTRTKCGKQELPLNEDFESIEVNKLPSCWDIISEDEYPIVVNGSAAYGADEDNYSKCLDFRGTDTKVLILPELNANMADLTVAFFYKSKSEATFTVGYIGSGDPAFKPIKALDVLSEYGSRATYVDLSGVPASAQYIAIQYSDATSAYAGSFMDNIQVMKTSDVPTGVENVQSDKVQGTKVIENGQLYLMYKGTKYDVQGKRIGNW